MLRSFPAISTIVDSELYSLSLSQPSCSLLIDLPPDFPAVEPIILVEPVLSHPSILPTGQVKVTWNVSTGSSLTTLLQQLQRDLSSEVNSANTPQTGVYQGYTSNYSNDSVSHVPSQQVLSTPSQQAFPVSSQQNTPTMTPTTSYAQVQTQTITPQPIPTSPVQLGLLQDDLFLISQLDSEQMADLLSDESAFSAFCSTLDTFRAQEDGDALMGENLRLAEGNLREKVVMDGLQKELEEAHERYFSALKRYQETLSNDSLKVRNGLAKIRKI